MYGHTQNVKEREEIASGGIPCLGDQLTFERLVRLKQMRNNERNSVGLCDPNIWLVSFINATR
jgi:hypothetical protein